MVESHEQMAFLSSRFHPIALSKTRSFRIGLVFWNAAFAALTFGGATFCRASELRVTHPTACWAGLLVLALLVVLACFEAGKRLMRGKGSKACGLFFCTSVVLALGLGYLWGDFLFDHFLRQAYELEKLQHYENINPSVVRGSQVSDAGSVTFTSDAMIDRAHAGCFVNKRTYCVAPIVNGGDIGKAPKSGSYDFFAVGVDCCDCPVTEYKCGDWFKPDVHGGLRLTDDGTRPDMHLAVSQWSATFGKPAGHPEFYFWLQDPLGRANGLGAVGRSWMELSVLGVAAIVAAIAALIELFDMAAETKAQAARGHNRMAGYRAV